MASIKQELMQRHIELKPLIDIYERHAYRIGYYQVFSDFVDYCVHKFSYPSKEDSYKLPRYITQSNEHEPHDFARMLTVILDECYQRCGMYTMSRQYWYDPFGSFFETVASDFGKSARGQFFTPDPICDLIAQITTPKIEQGEIGGRVMEPTCGSGRMVLAMNALNPGKYYVANDIDPICSKMCALNFCLNGVIGEVSCNDGLWPSKENFRFAYQSVPFASLPIAQNRFYTAWAFMSERIAKMYCLLPLSYENSGYSMPELDKAKIILPKANTLFDVEEIIKKHPKAEVKPSKQKPTKGTNNNLSLFDF